MPISSGFSYQQTSRSIEKPIIQPQIVTRSPRFRMIQRNKHHHGLFSNSKGAASEIQPPQRPTAVAKQPVRSDTFTLPTKRNESNSKVPTINSTQNGSPQRATKKPAAINSPLSHEQNYREPMLKNDGIQSMRQQPQSIIHERNPVRFANQHDHPYHSSPSVYNEEKVPVVHRSTQDNSDGSRRIRIDNNEYVIHRQKHSPIYSYEDYYTEHSTNKPRSQRIVQVIRDPPSPETEDLYYIEAEPKRIVYEQLKHRTALIRNPPAEYVYVDDVPSTILRQRHPDRSRIPYTGNDRPLTYEEETIYVDDHGNEVEYIYTAEPIYHRHNEKKRRQPASTHTVYE